MGRKKKTSSPIVIIDSVIVNSNITGSDNQGVTQAIYNDDIVCRLLDLLAEKDKQIDRLTKLLECLGVDNNKIGGSPNECR